MARTDYYGIQTPVLQATSQAIRTVNGTVGTIAPEDYANLISAMKSGTDYDNVMAQLVEETTTPAAIASFTDGSNNLPVKELICTINPTETGTGAKSPSNPYVIGGHTGINVTRTGKNLYKSEFEDTTISGTDIHLTDDGRVLTSGVPTTLFIFVIGTVYLTKGTYKLNGCPSNGGSGKYRLQVTDYPIVNSLGYDDGNGVTFTLSQDMTVAVRIQVFTGALSELEYKPMIRLASVVDDTFEPYITPTTHTADFGQTVYGGEFVAKEGEYDTIQPNRKYLDMGSLNWSYVSSGAYFTVYPFEQVSDLLIGAGMAISEIYKTNPTSAGFQTLQDGEIGTDVTKRRIYVKDSNYTDATAFKNAVTGKKIAYRIRTDRLPDPITLPTKTQVNTLLGANNIYHDCNGNTEVTYRANGGLYVAQH